MGGFLQALSALAPIAPAMSDARDIRLARQQQQETFASEQALKQAQLTTAQLAAEGERQRQSQVATPVIIGQPQWNPTTHTNQVLTFDKNTGSLALKDAPGVDPAVAAEAQYQAAHTDYKKVTGRDPTPEEDESLFFQSYGFKPPTAKVTQLTGDAGKPIEFPPGSGLYARAVGNPDGTTSMVPMPVGWKPPAPKPATSPSAILANLFTKQILANKKQGPPLTNEEAAQIPAYRAALDEAGVSRAIAMAQANAANRVFMATDPDTGMEIAVPISAGIAAYNQGSPFLAGVVSAPTGMDKKNQMLALSSIAQVRRMKNILRVDPNLTGPGAGQLTQLQTFLGTQDPDAQQFIISSLFASEHGVAVFGGRNIHTIQDLNNALGNMKTNPKALSAALDVLEETMTPWLTAGGRLPTPKTPRANPPSTPTAPGAPKTAADYLKSVGVQ